ncbi:MAG: hypothetical protein EAZ45_21065 [Oscillatoriales cyanobacterium]|nr:MAG: hypothetical protein EAZ45_21065 [Oscillatoriales cyanobacterium]
MVYTNLTLTNNTNVFEVNEGVAVTMTADGKYAFVAGRNSKKIIEVDANPLAGGNIGIIKDPLGPNPKLVAATEPVPGSLTNNVALSSDGKYLIGSYPTLGGGGSAYVFDVEEIIKTVENPGGKDLTKVAFDKINPKVVSKSFAIGGNPLGLLVAQNFEDILLRELEQFERLLSEPNNLKQIDDFLKRWILPQIQGKYPTIGRILRRFGETGDWTVADTEIIALLNKGVDRYRFDSSRVDGSGPHGVRAPIPEDREIHLIFRGVAGGANFAWFARLVGLGNFENLPNASRHMNHYLENSGQPLTIDMNEFMKVSSVKKNVEKAVEEAKKIIARSRKDSKNLRPNTLISGVRKSDRIRKEESVDWFFAVGDYSYWWQADPLTGEITVQIRDQYNWDQGKDVNILGVTIKDEVLGSLHQAGLAQEYQVKGEYKSRI